MDWWGYLDPDPTQSPAYLLKSGKQIRAIKAMLDRLTSAAIASARTPEPEFVAPPTVMAPDSSDTAIDVVWSSVHGATSYEVFRSDPREPDFHHIATVTGLSLGDAGLQPATLYHYEVRARLATGPGPFSMAASRATLSKVPPGIEPGSCAVR